MLSNLGYTHILVEIGGEIRTGKSRVGHKEWRIGVAQPDSSLSYRSLYAVIGITEMSMATSGDYRNFFIKDGKRYSHIIDPRKGHPVQTGVVSATVIGPNCMTADALATALPVIGAKPGVNLIESLEGYEALIIKKTKKGKLREYRTGGFGQFIK